MCLPLNALQSSRPIFHLSTFQSFSSVSTPAGGQAAEACDGCKLGSVERIDVERAPDTGKRPFWRAALQKREMVARDDGPGLYHPIIPAGTPGFLDFAGHVLLREAFV